MLRAVRFSDMPEPKPIDTSGAIPAEEVTWRRILDEEPEVGEVFMDLAAIKNKRGRWAIFP